MRRVGWIVAALVVGAAVPFFALGYQTGICVDSVVPGGSYCSSEPTIGLPAAIVLTVFAELFALWALFRGLRRKS